MTNAPEIAPEIRGLLEELVADPRSSIRLVPRRPLRYWFDSDETIRPREISGTKLERHILEVHREELADSLLAAARIAYWKAPQFAHWPRDAEGRVFNPDEAESRWRRRGGEPRDAARSEDVELLRRCLEGGLHSYDAFSLAKASLGVVPRDEARLYLGITVPWDRPRTAMQMLTRLESRACMHIASDAARHVAARLCCVGRLRDAQAKYRLALQVDPGVWVGHLYVFNLSCCLGDRDQAGRQAREADGMKMDGRNERAVLSEALAILRQWFSEKPALKAVARKCAYDIHKDLPRPLVAVCEVYSS